MDIGTVLYKLVDFHAIESFDDPKFNTKPRNPSAPDINGHSNISAGSIDPSLEGASPKQTLDFLAERGNSFRKEHSVIHGVYAHYIADVSTDSTKLGISLPIGINVPFDQYVSIERPEEIEVRLTAEARQPSPF